jgi:hypothetical protein
MTTTNYVEDYLTEDPVINNQQYFVLSYILPSEGNELEKPMIKISGSYRTIEECNKRIERIKDIEGMFDKFVAEVGKWSCLYTRNEIENLENVDVEYRNSQLNEMMKSKKQNQEEANLQFEERKDIMKKRAQFEGTKEGQDYLSTLKESPIAVKARLDFTSNEMEVLKQKLKDITEMYNEDTKKMEEYTPEELLELQEMPKESINPLTNKPLNFSENVMAKITDKITELSDPEPVQTNKEKANSFLKPDGKFDQDKFNEQFVKQANVNTSNSFMDSFGDSYNNSSLQGAPAFDGSLVTSNEYGILSPKSNKNLDNKSFNEMFEKNIGPNTSED